MTAPHPRCTPTVAALLAAAILAAAEAGPSVTSGSVTYNGRYTGTSKEFLGVPYAKAPVGEYRWFPPQPTFTGSDAAADGHVVGCTRFGSICPQSGPSQLAPNPDGTPQRASEDCLYLNVFAPVNSSAESSLPVMVFGHGGGDVNGASSMGVPILFNGSNTMRGTAGEGTLLEYISVTINYRLGTLGYLAHPAFESEKGGVVGNFGIWDHLAALTWVKDNIRAFGGNPNKVLFYGQSSGGNHALFIPVMKPFRGLVAAVAAHSACAQPFFNPDCGMQQSIQTATSDAIAFAEKHNCTTGDDAAVRACLRKVPVDAVTPGPGFGAYIGGSGDDVLLPDLPFNLYAKGAYDPTITIMAGHNSGESVEMGDSCFNNPALTLADVPASFGTAMLYHNRIQPPSWLVAEAVAMYLPHQTDAVSQLPLPACTPTGDTARNIPQCCRVYQDFWQDLNMQCSEDVLFDAVRAGAMAARKQVPPMYGWRFDQVQDCPPPLWPHGGWGGKPASTNSCFHTMELSWMFGTVSGFWSWIVPPNGALSWNCTWAADEKAFSNAAVSLWVQQALGSGRGAAAASTAATKDNELPLWPQHTAANRSRLNLKVGNITVLDHFREPYCKWWSTVYARIRKAQGF